MEKKRLAIIRIRGSIGVRKDIKDTLNMLRLYRKNSCVIIENNPHYVGMIKKAKDYITWGEISEEAFKQLLETRAKLPRNKNLTSDYLKEKTNLTFEQFTKEFFSFKKELKDIPGLKLFFRLKPPTKGFERKGIKRPFSLGGALGYRKEKINDIISRML